MKRLTSGDIYHWKYKDKNKTYWCESKIAIVNEDLLLYDTFWNSGRKRLNVGEIDLTYIANFSELEHISEHEASFYIPSDIVDLSHSNNRKGDNIYKKVGSRPQRDNYYNSISIRLSEIESEFERLQILAESIKRELSATEPSYNTAYKSKYDYLDGDAKLVWYKDRYYPVTSDNFVCNSSRLSEVVKQEIINKAIEYYNKI
jgi:hypothetical protein